ncbi:hypothetical protein MSG28_015102 [Choristoneura fumiferana]|uniref:Uncharacterized protein n=1 Tax=Choristoneura fumiferana TaxID=7141 RepID=A0ACC0KY97_CHOFU|nr:hypothetical protein MSG28_015102 [Choristoneura fumiferana]
MTSSNYSDRNLKRRAWEELVLIFCEGDDSEEKKKLLSSSLQKKWKSLRDNYMREVKKMKTVKSGSGASKTSSYIHFNRLQFLQPSIADKHTENSFNTENESASSEVAEVEGSSAFKSPKSTPRKKQKISPADERSQQSGVPNNLAHYGYTTAMGSQSPVTHTPSPAPTNTSNESELDLFCE